jgi:glycosyltransferase involved in cell wall biosynthesis
VVFREDGVLFALNPGQVARIFVARPSVESQEIRLPNQCPSATVAEERIACPSSPPPRKPALGLKLRATGALRAAARASISRTPESVREDVRAILIHGRQIARTLIYRGRSSLPADAPLDVPAQPTDVPAQPTDVPAQPTDVPALRDQILPTLQMVVHPRLGDVLWTAGPYANFVPLRTIGEMRVRTGLRVVTTCYDLIGVTHPEFNPPSMGAELFTGDAVALLDASDLVLTFSASTRSELVAFAARSGRPAPAVQVVRLGSDLAAGKAQPEPETPVMLEKLEQRRFALAVGTVEARKNYGLLVRVWERLAADPAFRLDLVIVGRRGFESDDSSAQIEHSPLFGSRIRWLERCPDETLCRLYETCHVVLCPSFAEGWGLPVTEALGFGRHVIASNRGAIPEAALGLARLLDPEEEATWLATIAEAAAAPPLKVSLPDAPTWDAAAAAVGESIRRLMTVAHAV